VLVYCATGRDRTGLITLVLLALVGVAAEDIAADYALSASGLARLFTLLGQQDQRSDAYLTRTGRVPPRARSSSPRWARWTLTPTCEPPVSGTRTLPRSASRPCKMADEHCRDGLTSSGQQRQIRA
jgi:hypothetical protein